MLIERNADEMGAIGLPVDTTPGFHPTVQTT
jgi:hypothetical protein